MSRPPTEPRSSLSSDPSGTSSYTLHSRHSGHIANNGQGSSTPNRSSWASERSSAGSSTQISRNAQSESPLRGELIGEHDFAHRRHRYRNSGGFLLDSTFPTAQRHGHEEGDTKGKRKARDPPSSANGRGALTRLRRENAAPSSNSPLSREIEVTGQEPDVLDEDNDALEGREAVRDNLRVAKTRKTTEGSAEGQQTAEPARAAIDPSQIVNMALNLSASRKRNLSAGQLLIPPPSTSKRASSAAGIPTGSYQNYGVGSSLRQHLQQQRRISRNVSPGAGRNSASASRHVSTSSPRNFSPAPMYQSPGVPYNFSEATIARRDKARAYMELSLEYLRLLEYLPPLKPDASAPGNFIVTAANVPGSPHAELTRVPSYANSRYRFGRPYNPLQCIRNRRTRNRERKPLEHADEFEDVDKVRNWVDAVEKESRRPGYRHQDGVFLPEFHGEHPSQEQIPSKPSRTRMCWAFAPSELLADAYWLEQDNHKSLVEDHFGRKIFASKQQAESLQPRVSKEYPDKRRKSWIDLGGTSEPPTGDESDAASDRGRKKRHLLVPFHGDEAKGGKRRSWHRSRTHSRSPSNISDSENGSPRRRTSGKFASHEDNTGPLELQVKGMLDNESKEAEMTSPSVGSPDKWGFGHSNIAGHISQGAAGPRKSEDQEAIRDLRRKPAEFVLSPDSLQGPRSSFEDLDSTAPNTPVLPRFPTIGADLSPPDSRGHSVTRKSRRSKLDIFRSDESKQEVEAELDVQDRKTDSRRTNGKNNILDAPMIAAPLKMRLGHKKDDSVSSLVSSDRHSRKDVKEPSSAVTRFFKGSSRLGERVKNEGSKVGEFIFRRDRPADDSETSSPSTPYFSDSEMDDSRDKTNRRPRPRDIRRTTTSSTIESIPPKSNGYHLDLPSFRSSNANALDPDPDSATESDHPITRQARERANSRSPRFDRLAPPRMDLRSISANSSPSRSREPSPTATRDRLTTILDQSGRVGRGGLPVTALTHPNASDSPESHRSASRPKLEQRHWSITDDRSPSRRTRTSTAVTKADIARIRALLLCSGIKAHELSRRAHTRRQPPRFLKRAAEIAGAELIPVPRKEEHVLAARILTRSLEASTRALHDSAERFRNSTCADLQSRLDSLKATLEEEVFPRVRKSGDEAMHISSEVAGTAPLVVKNVSDEIDNMMRMRRRRTRWARRVGWMLVEWVLLGAMWWVWFIVVIWRLGKGVVMGVVRTMRWFLWI